MPRSRSSVDGDNTSTMKSGIGKRRVSGSIKADWRPFPGLSLASSYQVSMYDSAGFVRQARQVGANGYIVKGRSPEELLSVIRQVADGVAFVANSDSTDERREDGVDDAVNVIEELTPRQIDVLRLLAIGKSTKEIASALFISDKTVEHHRTNIRRATGIFDTAKLVLFAVKHGIVTPADIDRSVGL